MQTTKKSYQTSQLSYYNGITKKDLIKTIIKLTIHTHNQEDHDNLKTYSKKVLKNFLCELIIYNS